MVTLNKSFFYGVILASITWVISLYLVYQLYKVDQLSNSNPLLNTKLPLESMDKDHISKLGMVTSLEEKTIRDDGYRLHAFNALVSNQLGNSREIPDVRNKLCKDVVYGNKLPTASIIICFYNEHYQTLLRSIHSIIERTPSNLLREIILINDFSDLPHLHSDLSKYISENFHTKISVHLHTTSKREGLIRARVFGSRKAIGDVLVFLDSHIEVNINWLQPLLARIKEDKKHVVMPIIDIINADTFMYSGSPLVRGGFNWGLHFKWENLPKGTLSKDEDFIHPIKSPTMAGGLFAIDKKYFVDMGEYDEGMNIWGGENLEISFRVWMCGGSLELIPCSRVGHVFRHRRPYRDPEGQDTMLHNSLRVAHVWLDDYKKYFLEHHKKSPKLSNYGDISSRIQLRSELKCNNFEWYLKNVYPELILPSDSDGKLQSKVAALEQDKHQPWHSRKRNYLRIYQLRLANSSSLCVQGNLENRGKDSVLVLQTCVRRKNQMWFETDKKELVLAQLLCLQANQPNPHLYKCHEMGGDQEWKHKGQNNSPIYNMAAGTCLAVDKKEIGAIVTLKMCTDTNYLAWDLIEGKLIFN